MTTMGMEMIAATLERILGRKTRKITTTAAQMELLAYHFPAGQPVRKHLEWSPMKAPDEAMPDVRY